MKRPVVVAVDEPPATFAALIEAAAAAGLRVGWLDLSDRHPVPPGLEAAAAAGVLRAVAAGPIRTVAVKPRRGAPVLDDLLREHFRGCALVLVVAASDLPSLRSADRGWRLRGDGPAGRTRALSTADLIRALRRPGRWRAPGASAS